MEALSPGAGVGGSQLTDTAPLALALPFARTMSCKELRNSGAGPEFRISNGTACVVARPPVEETDTTVAALFAGTE